jgi:ABC-type lipoprotein release transport system permease subunit
MERLREFGIMMAIGFSPSRLFRLVMWESLWMGIVGLVSCVVITAGPYYYLVKNGINMTEMYGDNTPDIGGVGFDPVMRVGIYPENLAVIMVAIVVATLLAGLYPAWRAGRVVPVETIKLV